MLPSAQAWRDALDLKRKGGEWVGECPVCGGTDRFHVSEIHEGRALFGCRGCIDGKSDAEKREAVAAILKAAGFTGDTLHPQPARPAHSRRKVSQREGVRIGNARRLWERTEPADRTPAAHYLRAVRYCWPPGDLEGAPALPADVRWLPANRWPAQRGFPRLPEDAAGCLAFGFRYGDSQSRIRAVSLEAVSEEGDRLPGPRRWRPTLGVQRGCWFSPERIEGADVAAVEGEIDALAAHWLYPGFEVRAYGGTAGLRNAQLPNEGRGCVILPDGDGAGQRAAAALVKRCPAVRVHWRDAGDPALDWLETIQETASCRAEGSPGISKDDAIRLAWRERLQRRVCKSR